MYLSFITRSRKKLLMKRSSFIEDVASLLISSSISFEKEFNYKEAKRIAETIELYTKQIGMLPPINTCVLVPDPLRPGYHKHSESKREWDEEND